MADSTPAAASPVVNPAGAGSTGPGLSSAEAALRAQQGRSNVDTSRQRTDWDVVRDNTLSFFNAVLFSLIGLLIAVGEFRDGFFVGLVVGANIAIATAQEMRAVRTLRKLRALSAPTATVIRDGIERTIPAEEVVEGDVVILRTGDQVVADGHVADGLAEVDESLLTGESESVRKEPGAILYSGSFATSGECRYAAEAVGTSAYIVRLTADARSLVRRETPLQRRFRRVLRVLLTATAALGLLLLISFENEGREFTESIKAVTATLTSVVPEGLLLGLTVAFSIGAVAVSRSRAIVQDINAVEALNYVDVICLDKTGTITANRLQLDRVLFAPGREELRPWLAAFASEARNESKTVGTVAEALEGQSNGATTEDHVPFNSERRWSARRLAGPSGEKRTFVLGAPETVLPMCTGGEALSAAYEDAAGRGLRGVVLAEASRLPEPGVAMASLQPVALVTLADELRPEIRDAFEVMRDKEIAPKVISGDNPETVAALMRQLDIPIDGAISGVELEQLDDAAFREALERNTVFGRIDPQLKARIVSGLKTNGHFVVMVGDGANDVRALREADVAVAMASGTATTRAVAQFILMGDSFHALIRATDHAETVLGNSARLSKLFITKSLYAFILIFATNMLSLNFPFLPRQGTLTTLLTLGIPTVVISLGRPPRGSGRDYEMSVLRFAVPAALALAAAAVTVHLLTEGLLGRSVEESRTLVSIVIAVVGIVYVLEVLGFEGASLRSLTRPVMTFVFCSGLVAMLLLVLYTPWLRDFFELVEMGPTQWAIVIPAIVGAVAGQYVFSNHWQRLIDILIAKPRGEQQRGRVL